MSDNIDSLSYQKDQQQRNITKSCVALSIEQVFCQNLSILLIIIVWDLYEL